MDTANNMKGPRDSAFISYCREDAGYLEELHTHLRPYERTGKIKFWDDTKMEPGERWRKALDDALQSAKVAVFLVSAELLASDFIAKKELPVLLGAAEHEEVVIISVILRPSAFRASPLSEFQTANDPSEEPLCNVSVGRRNEIWMKLAYQIKNILRL